MTTETQNAEFKTFFYGIAATGEIKQGTTKGGKPFASFKGDVSSSKKTMKRTVTVFNTQRNPNLVADVVALGGTGRFVIAFDKGQEEGQGETVRIVGISKAKAANDEAADQAAAA